MRLILVFFGLISVFIVSAFVFYIHPTDKHKEFVAYQQAISGSKLSIAMIPIQGGTFEMGSPESEPNRKTDEGPQHPVKIEPFWMSQYEITWEQYELFRAREIDKINEKKGNEVNLSIDGVSGATAPYTDMSFGMGKEGYPVINITQYAAATFCKWLSAKTGHFYRLPTEAEWEYACRAGSKTAYFFGEDASLLGDYAWYNGNSEEKYHLIGQKKPNPWGLYDMHGNVAEWTLDQYVPNFYEQNSKKTQESPWAIPSKVYPHTVRGGSWKDMPEKLRSAARLPSSPKWKKRDPQLPKSLWWMTDAPFVGIRIVRPLHTPSAKAMEKYWLNPIEEY